MRSARALFALGITIWLAGCATPESGPQGSGSSGEPVIIGAPERLPARDPRPTSSSTSTAADPLEPLEPLSVRHVALLFASSTPAHAAIAGRIETGLAGPAIEVQRIDIDRPDTAADDKSMVDNPEGHVVVAIGADALDIARQQFVYSEIIYSQVLEPGADVDGSGLVRGVASMPSPALQFAAWTEVDPDLRRIGLITSARFARLVPDARQAAAGIGAELVHRISTTDRETLYLFRRMAPDIDGLWLPPDSEILSMAIIEELLAHAVEFEVGVLVFSDSLLGRGGLINVSAPVEHVAETVIAAIKEIHSGRACALPREIPLAAGTVQVNGKVAEELGLPDTTPAEWVIHDRQ